MRSGAARTGRAPVESTAGTSSRAQRLRERQRTGPQISRCSQGRGKTRRQGAMSPARVSLPSSPSWPKFGGMWLGLKMGSGLVGSLAVGLVCTGCSGDDAAREELRALARKQCEHAESCRCAGTGRDADCLEERRALWDARVDEARDLGLRYDAACVEAIAARLEEYGCASAAAGPEHLCASYCAVFHGDRELGTSCQRHDDTVSDCAQGLVCREGSCVEPCPALTGRTEGQRCMSEEGVAIEDCAHDLHCSWQSGLCEAPAQAGESCASRDCATDLWCDYTTSFCRASLGEGEPCETGRCDQGLFCDWNSGPGECRPSSRAGESCSERTCADGLWCDYDAMICREPGQEGASCSYGPCASGFVCDFSTEKCVMPPGEGQPCLNGACHPGTWCDVDAMPEPQCMARKQTGEPCSGHAQCESVYCPTGFCRDRPGEGEDCSVLPICENGLVCDTGVCVPAVVEGPAVCAFPGW